jgi:hypothetical protein
MYINLPGSYVQLQDGNLTFSTPDLTQSVLVLGTATKGLTSEPFLMSDVGAVVREFGADSELARAASEVKKGGASNIYVYRLPGTPPVLSALGADVDTASAAGITIRTTQESPEAAAKYGVAYRHAKNIATSGSGAANDKSVSAELIIVNLETDTVVWQGTALEGASLDNGEVDVEFDLGDVDLGIGSGAENEKLSFSLTIDPATKAYTALATTNVSATGSDATVTVTVNVPAAAGAYTSSNLASVAIAAAGTGYTVGDTIKVSGALLGGVVTTNDLTLTVATITGLSPTGPIATFSTTYSGNLAVHGVSGTCTIPVSGVSSAYTFTGVTNLNALATAIATAIDTDAKLPFGATASTNVVTVSANGTTVAGELVYPATHPWFGYTARPYFSGTPTISVSTPSWGGTATATVAAVTPTSHGRASDIGLYPQDAAKPFAVAGGGVYVTLDKVVSGGVAVSYGLGGAVYTHASLSNYAGYVFDESTAATFTAGSADSSISLMKRYEKLHTAFENLDLAAFDMIVPYGVTIDAKNTADGDSMVISGGAYPPVGQANDVLCYLVAADNGDYTYTYYWSTTGITTDLPDIASDGVLPVDGEFQYKEVNFGHLLANYCYENSEDYRTCHGVIGTRLPGSITARGIREYFGKTPTYAYDRETGNYFITDESNNGSGLLGHKFIGGKYTFNDGVKRGGLFATEDRALDYSASNLKYDANGKKIDLGKYLSVVAIFGTTADDVNTRGPAYITNAATIVAGMLPNLSVIDSLINRSVPGLFIPYRLETKTVDVACGLGLTIAKVENGIPLIADSPTFASPTSDYTRLTTVRIVAKLAEELRAAARPYLGKGLSAIKRNALEAAIGEVLKLNLGDGTGIQVITAGRFKLSQTAEERVLGKVRVDLTITPVFELRQVTFSVNLSV